MMTEDILKIRAEELAAIRLVFGNGEIDEMPIANAATYFDVAHDAAMRSALQRIVNGLQYFSPRAQTHQWNSRFWSSRNAQAAFRRLFLARSVTMTEGRTGSGGWSGRGSASRSSGNRGHFGDP